MTVKEYETELQKVADSYGDVFCVQCEVSHDGDRIVCWIGTTKYKKVALYVDSIEDVKYTQLTRYGADAFISAFCEGYRLASFVDTDTVRPKEEQK